MKVGCLVSFVVGHFSQSLDTKYRSDTKVRGGNAEWFGVFQEWYHLSKFPDVRDFDV